MKYYIFVIDTDIGTGNFNRHLCAHITNQIGECEVGESYLTDIEDLAEEHPEYSIDDLIRIRDFFEMESYHTPDDNGIRRPCKLFATPGRSNNGSGFHYNVSSEHPFVYPAYESVGITFDSKPSTEVLEFMEKRAKTFTNRIKFNILGYRLLEIKTVETELWSSK